MFTAYAIITAITIAANASVTIADLARANFVLANMDELGIPRSWLVPLGLLKGAGAAGLVLGLLGLRGLGIAAACGLVVFFAGAVVTHLRARVFHNIALPGAFLTLAVAATVLHITAQ